jgi:uncharacterized protein (TIGR02145 family)
MKNLVILIMAIFLGNIAKSQNEMIQKTVDSTIAKSTSVSSNTTSSGTVTDIDGNVYLTITYNHQTWMKENLKVTRYSNGDTIKTTSDLTLDFDSLIAPKYQWAYDGDEKNVPIYGRLYTWYVITDSRNVCPSDWHVPTDEEFCLLENTIEPGSDPNCNIQEHRGKNQGGYMKEAGLTFWKEPNTGGDNRSAFSILPSGIRYSNALFHCLGSHCYLWTTNEVDSTNGRTRRFYYDSKDISRGQYQKGSSLAVRCLKD